MPKRALISVSDKRGLPELGQKLQSLGWQIISTGGTKGALEKANVPVTPVEEVTRFPESFSGRVKTLHPMLLGGVLYCRGKREHEREAQSLGIEPIDLVVVNLYPFEAASAMEKEVSAACIELIDIGGPTLLRAAAKNYISVTALCDPDDYPRVLRALEEHGETSPELRQELAAKVFLHTAAYDAVITEHLSGGKNAGVLLAHGQKLRYGENPHQWGKYYTIGRMRKQGWGEVLQGKEMSYLNILDADAAWSTVQEFTEPTAVFLKHANPSGIASHESLEGAFQRAYDTDRTSAFGVIIALNRTCTEVVARKILDQNIFTEVIIAPAYVPEALMLLQQKPNIRVIHQEDGTIIQQNTCYRSVTGGMLVQNADTRIVVEADLACVTKRKPSPEQIHDMLFAWKAVKHAKSNAIVFASDLITVGIGCGQTSRVDATWIAARRAGGRAKGAVMASDAFFPFPDAVEEAAKHGIAAIIQPGGSIRDAEVFAKADVLGLTMVVTGVRAFRH